jgi:HlyD family secretion protein
MIQKIKTFIFSHKIISIIILIAIVLAAYFFMFKSKTTAEARYVTQTVKKENIITTVSGSGQVEASSTITLSSKTSGDITYVGVKAGDTVYRGKLIASVDSRDAKMALENAKISLAKLKKPDTLTLLQKQNGLAESYNSGWNTASSFLTDMTLVVSNLGDLYHNDGYFSNKNINNSSSLGKDKINLAQSGYYDSLKSIDDLTKLYKTLTRSSSNQDITDLLNKSYDSSKIIANAVKNTETAFNYMVTDLNYENLSTTTSTRANITSWLTSSNGYVNSLSLAVNSIKENTQSLNDTVIGADPLDIQSAELSVESKQNAYDDCFVYAPFDGVVATFTAQVGEPSGSSIGTLITKQKLATISLNEVDIAKIKLGQKATLTFDAIDVLTITGVVSEIDSIGTVSQGVVSYSVKIGLDVGDDRIKPGMSVSATIITDMAQDVITVPTSAIKTQNGTSYVETFDSPLVTAATGVQGSTSLKLPNQVEVTLGLVGDSSTEIISGLKEGDIVVTKTISGVASTTKTSTTPSLLNAVGGNRGAAGAFRN